MSLSKKVLSEEFRQKLCAQPSASNVITRIGAVGVESRYKDIGHYEENRLNAVNRYLRKVDFSISVESTINPISLRSDQDFLAGAFNGQQIELLVLSRISYRPGRLGSLTNAAKQSPLAHNKEHWIEAFKNLNALIIVNMWHDFDCNSGRGLSGLIADTNMYSSVLLSFDQFMLTEDLIDKNSDFNIGGEIFLRNTP